MTTRDEITLLKNSAFFAGIARFLILPFPTAYLLFFFFSCFAAFFSFMVFAGFFFSFLLDSTPFILFSSS